MIDGYDRKTLDTSKSQFAANTELSAKITPPPILLLCRADGPAFGCREKSPADRAASSCILGLGNALRSGVSGGQAAQAGAPGSGRKLVHRAQRDLAGVHHG